MAKVCSMCCFICKHPDCINDEPPTLREIAIIEADNRYVQLMQMNREERQAILERRRKQLEAYHADGERKRKYSMKSKEKQREYMKQ